MMAAVGCTRCSDCCSLAPAQPQFKRYVQPRNMAVSAISKTKKATIVTSLTEKIQRSTLIYGVSYDKVKVADLESFRRDLPENVDLMVTKNRLLRVAVDQLGEEEAARWAGLKGMKGQNAYVFADEESIRPAVKAYNAFFKRLKDKQEEPKKGEKGPPAPSEIKCIVMDGQALDIAQWQTLDKIPTKQELLTKIAVGIKANPTKIALSIKAVPRKLAFGVKALADLNDDKSMVVQAAVDAKAAESS